MTDLTFDPALPLNGATLAELDNTVACDGTYVCTCAGCHIERLRHIKRGVRPSQPVPIKRKRAA